jgi:hypothetical protein
LFDRGGKKFRGKTAVIFAPCAQRSASNIAHVRAPEKVAVVIETSEEFADLPFAF